MNRWPLVACFVLSVAVASLITLQLRAYPPPGEPLAAKEEKRTVYTSGTATVRVKPDSARLFLSVQTFNKSLKEARTENATRVAQVFNAIRALQVQGRKIPDMKMKTVNVDVSLVYSRPGEEKAPEVVGYRVTNSFTVLLTDNDPELLSQFASQVLDVALENGVNQISGISFFKADLKEAQREALMKAVADAEANAQAMARGARVTLKEPISLNGSPEFRPYFDYRLTNAVQTAIGGADLPLVAGDIEVTCNVNVTFTY
ncbi:MAG: SIMPL domain-containing protein [Gemmatales bacterium]|nr:SIMPL domain-containing protein [Gemmatales bacterium]MDW8386630.1 SIMPL domain-containing protein [Gemmatales bacterium]